MTSSDRTLLHATIGVLSVLLVVLWLLSATMEGAGW